MGLSIPAYSQTKKINDLENQRKKALQEIASTNKLLLDTKKTTATLLDRIKLISTQIISRQEVISLLNQEIAGITAEQKKTEAEIIALEAELKEKQNSYALAVKGMIRKKQNTNKLLFVLSGRSLGESVRRMRYLRDYSEWRNLQAEDIKSKQIELNEKKLALEQSRKEKIKLLDERKAEQSKLKDEEQTHQKEVTEAGKKQKELQALLQKKQVQADALNKQIEKLIAEEVARQEREAKRIAEEKARLERERNKNRGSAKPETGTGTASTTTTTPAQTETKESLNLSSNFVANKGKFPMPVTGGNYTIVGKFGTQNHTRWNVSTNSNGIDIQTNAGSEARSIFEGEVSRVFAFPGSNNCILVRHGGYYTVYANIQQVYVQQGQKITSGQSLGRIYTDADTGKTQLHFELWKGTTKLNPEPWLKR